MNTIENLPQHMWPKSLLEIPQPPERLYIRGQLPPAETHYICSTPAPNMQSTNMRFVCIVGSRNASPYGIDMCTNIISGLQGYPISIVSGLAMGIDATAHRAALDAKLHTVAFPGSGLNDDVLYPRSNYKLADEIIYSGGALISEYEPDMVSRPYAFPQRNRLMAGISELIIVIECSMDSGSLITAKLGLDYNKTIGAVPGSAFARNSAGPHYLLRQGACLVDSAKDILTILNLAPDNPPTLFEDLPSDETVIVKALAFPMSRDDLMSTLNWPVHKVQTILARMEIKGLVEERLGEVRLKR